MNLSPKAYSVIIRDKKIPHGAFRLWHLLRDMTGKNKNCWPSQRTICETLECGNATLLRWLGALVVGGYLRITPGGRVSSSRYVVGCASTVEAQVPPRWKHGASTVEAQGASTVEAELNSVEPNSSKGGACHLFPRELKLRMEAIEEYIEEARNELNTYGTKPERAAQLRERIKSDRQRKEELNHQLAYGS